MAKLVQFVITTIGIMLLLILVGIPTLSSQLLGLFLGFGTSDISVFKPLTDLGAPTIVIGGSVIFVMLMLALGFSASLAGFAVNVFRPTESVIIATICTMLLGIFVADFTAIMNIASPGIVGGLAYPLRALLILIFIPYAAAFILSIIAYWRGNDI